MGTSIIYLCEEIAIENAKSNIRLDRQDSNSKLNEYYNKLGFRHVGIVHDGNYIGNKLEKKLKY